MRDIVAVVVCFSSITTMCQTFRLLSLPVIELIISTGLYYLSLFDCYVKGL